MAQMMSLQTYDRTYPAKMASKTRLSPLLSPEALRRVAWSTFYIDSVIDGGRYGFHVIDECAYRIQLPCEESRFLGNEPVATDWLFQNEPSTSAPRVEGFERAPLGMSAYLIRTAAARRRALHFAFRASHKEQTVGQLTAELASIEADSEAFISDLPKRFQLSSDSMRLHRGRLTTFILLHVLRHNLFIILGRAALYIYQQEFEEADLIMQYRQSRISHALPTARLIADGLREDVVFDPQIGLQAYIALESTRFLLTLTGI